MFIRREVFFLSLLVVFLSLCPSEARDIYVRLADTSTNLTLTAEGGMKLVDAAQKNHELGKTAVLSHSGGALTVGKNKFALPVRISGSGTLGYNKRKYRGELLITREFVLINVLDVEDYIRGVLPVEASSKWPMEYLKVQAVISRTYGLRQSLNRSARGYDVVDTVSDQVYRGAGVESPRTNQAVNETAGQVLAYENALAFTPFHSDSGGYTANNAHVWGKNLPYLIGVKEPLDYRSPNSTWVAKISTSQMQDALAKVGCNVGRVQEIRVAEVDTGGRATNFLIVGSNASSPVKASLFRMAVGPNLLKSTMLSGGGLVANNDGAIAEAPSDLENKESNWSPEVAEESDSFSKNPVPTSDMPMSTKEETHLTRMTADGNFTSAELMDMLMNPDKRKGYLYMAIQRGNSAKKSETPGASSPKSQSNASMPTLSSGQVITEENGNFIFRGKGWGHGVGLSQWGAQALAAQGWTAERILEHYYPGTAVKRFK